jgi:hypothetical protein
MQPEIINHHIRILFMLASGAGLVALCLLFRKHVSQWRAMVGSAIYFLEIGIFYTVRLLNIPDQPIYANWISSILHLSGMLLVFILTRELVRSLK